MIWSDIVNGMASNEANNATMSSVKNKDLKDGKDATTLDVNDFLQLLVAQMQYQDPLEPTDNTQYIAQMATFSQVEATTQMYNKVEQQMASSLVGKTVIVATDLSKTGLAAGTVDYWEVIDGTVYLGIDGKLYDIADLDTVMDESYYDKIVNDSNNKTENTDKTDDTDKTQDSGKVDDTDKTEGEAEE